MRLQMRNRVVGQGIAKCIRGKKPPSPNSNRLPRCLSSPPDTPGFAQESGAVVESLRREEVRSKKKNYHCYNIA